MTLTAGSQFRAAGCTHTAAVVETEPVRHGTLFVVTTTDGNTFRWIES